ncbi:21 kDa protein-like [Cornus florida]|uniref:21 kDa protein-like n=1 Tax=Cornus florida TaxID=4283 RepID=UPI00289A1D25|nr:21 kDa protein-like [Cornus florida]
MHQTDLGFAEAWSSPELAGVNFTGTGYSLAILQVQPISAVESPNPEPTKATDFIRIKCNATLHPELCYTSLSGFANAIQEDPARLANVAIVVSLSKTKHMAKYVANISLHFDTGGNKGLASALHVCSKVFSSAVDEIRYSLSEMKRLRRPGQSQSVGSQIGDVQTSMTAAIAYEDTCTESLEEIEYEGPLKTDICDRAEKVFHFMGNALNLVMNAFADTVAAPAP